MHSKQVPKTGKSIGKSRGFTLIELLIVIAIIALIAAILFPVFARAREKARSAACQSNLKQIALAFHQYTADYDERLPHAWDSDLSVSTATNICGNCTIATNSNEPIVWPAKIEPYTKSRQVFSCPSDSGSLKSPCNATTVPAAVSGWAAGVPVVGNKPTLGSNWYTGASQTAYGYNVFYLGGNRYPGFGSCLSRTGVNPSLPYSNGIGALLSSIADSSNTVLLCDNSFSNQGTGNAPAFLDFPSFHVVGAEEFGDNQCRIGNSSVDAWDSLAPRHSVGLNVAFLDGHVKWMKKEVLMAGVSFESCNGSAAIHTNTSPNFLWNRY